MVNYCISCYNRRNRGVLFMARKLRIEYPGAFYHVIQRGNNREYVFERQVDKLFLVNQMRKAVNVDNIDIFAYVIMNNH